MSQEPEQREDLPSVELFRATIEMQDRVGCHGWDAQTVHHKVTKGLTRDRGANQVISMGTAYRAVITYVVCVFDRCELLMSELRAHACRLFNLTAES